MLKAYAVTSKMPSVAICPPRRKEHPTSVRHTLSQRCQTSAIIVVWTIGLAGTVQIGAGTVLAVGAILAHSDPQKAAAVMVIAAMLLCRHIRGSWSRHPRQRGVAKVEQTLQPAVALLPEQQRREPRRGRRSLTLVAHPGPP